MVARFEDDPGDHGERAPGDPDDTGGQVGRRRGAPTRRSPSSSIATSSSRTCGYLTQPPARIYLYDIATKKLEPLLDANMEAAAPSWSPDGKMVGFMARSGKDADRYNTSNLFVVEARAGAVPKQLTNYDGITASASRGRGGVESGWQAAHLPAARGAKQGAYNMNRVAVVPVAGGEPRVLASALDRSISAPRFARDGASILALVSDDRSEYPARIALASGEAQRLARRPMMVSAMEQGKDGKIALVYATDNTSGEIHAFENGEMRALTHQNDALLAELALGATEEFSCKAKDGTEVHGLMVKPAGYVAGKKYPTLLRIHGGPNGQDSHAFNFERQLFAAAGYVVLAVNYRGSWGRGEKYQVAISADWGNKEVIDLQAAVDCAVYSRPFGSQPGSCEVRAYTRLSRKGKALGQHLSRFGGLILELGGLQQLGQFYRQINAVPDLAGRGFVQA